MIGTCFYIFLFGVRMGSRTTDIWLKGAVISLLEDMILLKPMKLYIKWVGMSVIITSDISILQEHLFSKFKLIMLRSSGLMRSANSLIQHMNPACRAARQFPGLPMSRLLMSLTDFDFPKDLAHKRHFAAGLLELGSIAALLFITSLPDEIEDVVYDSMATTGTGALLIVLSFLAQFSIVVPVALVVVFVGVPVVYYGIHWRRHGTAGVTDYETTLDEILDMELENEGPKFKQRARKTKNKHHNKAASILPIKIPSVKTDLGFIRAFSFVSTPHARSPGSPGGNSYLSRSPGGVSMPSVSPASWSSLSKRANNALFADIYVDQDNISSAGGSRSSQDLSHQISKYFRPGSGSFSPITVSGQQNGRGRPHRYTVHHEEIPVVKETDDEMDYVITSENEGANEQGETALVRADSGNAFSLFDEIYRGAEKDKITYSTNDELSALRQMQSAKKTSVAEDLSTPPHPTKVKSAQRSLNRTPSRFAGENPLSAHKSAVTITPRTPMVADTADPVSINVESPALIVPKRLAPIVGKAPKITEPDSEAPARPKSITEVFGHGQGLNPLKRSALAPRGMRVPAIIQDFESKSAGAPNRRPSDGSASVSNPGVIHRGVAPAPGAGLPERLAIVKSMMPPAPMAGFLGSVPVSTSASSAVITRRPTVRQLLAERDAVEESASVISIADKPKLTVHPRRPSAAMRTSTVDGLHASSAAMPISASAGFDIDRLVRLRSRLLPANSGGSAGVVTEEMEMPSSPSSNVVDQANTTLGLKSPSIPRRSLLFGNGSADVARIQAAPTVISPASSETITDTNSGLVPLRRRPSVHAITRIGQEARQNITRSTGSFRSRSLAAASRPRAQMTSYEDGALDDEPDIESFIDME
jgi:hypothetical protein